MSTAESVMRSAIVRRRCDSGWRSIGPHCSNFGSGGGSTPTAASGLAAPAGRPAARAAGAGGAWRGSAAARADVVVGHAPTGPVAAHRVQIHPELAREPPRCRRRRHRPVVGRAAPARS